MGLGSSNSADIYWVLNTGNPWKLNLNCVVFRPYILVTLWGPPGWHMCRASQCLALSICSVTASREVKMTRRRKKKKEEEDTACALREPTGLLWTIRRECTQITASAQSARSLTGTYLAVASHQKEASQVLQSSWAQPALARRKTPELRWLKGLVVGVIVIPLHSIRQRKLETLSRVPKPSLNWLHFYGSKGCFF